MVPRPEIGTVLVFPCSRNGFVGEGSLSVLHGEPGREVSQIVCAGSIRVVLLRDAECSQAQRQQEKLGEIGADQIARRKPAEQRTRRNLTAPSGPFEVREIVDVSDRRRSDWLVTVLGEWDVTG